MSAMNGIKMILQAFALGAFLLVLPQASTAAEPETLVARSNDLVTELDNYRVQLEELESEFGPYDRSLLEPLQGMVAVSRRMQDYQTVAELQNRQLQVMRTELGFQHPDLIPVLRDIIANQIQLQNWEQVSEYLEHIRFLSSANDEQSPLPLLEALQFQADWYLARVALDKPELRTRNFMAARSLFDEMEKIAEEHFGEESLELIPWLYKSAVVNYQLVEFLNAKDGLSSETIDRLIREDGASRLQLFGNGALISQPLLSSGIYAPVVAGDELVGEDYLLEGRQLVGRISRLVEEQADLEAQAMLDIYFGDFQLLMGRGGAFRRYRDAREKLQQAGIDESRIEQYFNQPTVIPMSQLFLRLEDAIQYQQDSLGTLEDRPEGIVYVGQFVAWEESLAEVQRPLSSDSLLNIQQAYHQVDIKFSLSSSGRISAAEVIQARPDEEGIEREAWRAVRDMQIRPVIIAGKAQRTKEVQLRYLFLER